MSEKKKPNLLLAMLPLVLFLGLAGIFYSLLVEDGRDVSALPSALLNRPAPLTPLPPLEGSERPGLSPDMLKGKVSVVNVFASWCVPCRAEHPQIIKLGKDKRLQIIGINQRDSNSNALEFINELGNPFDVIGVDHNGRASIEWGVYGVPETFFVDENGVIFYKHVGPISPKILNETIFPLLESKLLQTQ